MTAIFFKRIEKDFYLNLLIYCLTVVWSFKLLCCGLKGQLDLRVVQPQLELDKVDMI